MTIPLRPSRRLAQLQVLAHVVALTLVGLVSLPMLYTGPLAAAIGASALLVLRRIRNPVVSTLHLGRMGALEIEAKVGASETATILPQTTILPGLIVLLVRQHGRTRCLCLPIDAMGRQAHRRMRLWLKWQCGQG